MTTTSLSYWWETRRISPTGGECLLKMPSREANSGTFLMLRPLPRPEPMLIK
ncbi:UNVERIFIED_CONTAM: hypothetical protein GTU68_036490 [Idotea baltica]|nr:hypothetical protein [Idotea baltica]